MAYLCHIEIVLVSRDFSSETLSQSLDSAEDDNRCTCYLKIKIPAAALNDGDSEINSLLLHKSLNHFCLVSCYGDQVAAGSKIGNNYLTCNGFITDSESV